MKGSIGSRLKMLTSAKKGPSESSQGAPVMDRSKTDKDDKMHKVMSEFKHGSLHSGSKKGPKVKKRKQAIAIGMKQSGMSKY